VQNKGEQNSGIAAVFYLLRLDYPDEDLYEQQ
jgi:hypothetical protein